MAYITGPKTADRAILYIYDVFSFQPQSLQGADILAYSSSKPCLVVMVDWFKGGAVQHEWITSKKEEDRKLMYQFLETTASPVNVLPSVFEFLAESKEIFPNVKRWGSVGFCWGGKLVSLVSAKGDASPLVAAAQSSPARMDPEEAKKVIIPMAILASAKEDASVVKQYGENLRGEKGELEKADVRSEITPHYMVLIPRSGYSFPDGEK
ncbi:putative dienelactone hydrolase family protein [Eutypa lata UCREL1]|uniref:Putative dienelactone hydrolase family protein n=1 Tax=Eutypa lata (strain UCR-EL1) TaxID=1287681 RepID=M7STA4_EUTLA|nr:putative dienelactone hydrolase family protein [Eutypa lata UCREL1]